MNLLSMFRNPMLIMPMLLFVFMGLSKLLPKEMMDFQEMQREVEAAQRGSNERKDADEEYEEE